MNVAEVCNNYDVIIIHGTKLNGGADGSKCIPQNASVFERLVSAHKSRTSICCSTFSEGDRLRNIFAPVGHILSDGEIIAAAHDDLGSSSDDDCNRFCDIPPIPLADQVENAIMNRDPYNEFLINNHAEFGIYICIDDPLYLDRQIGDFLVFKKNVENLLGLPIFGISNGYLYSHVEYDYFQKSFVVNNIITLRSLIEKYCL